MAAMPRYPTMWGRRKTAGGGWLPASTVGPTGQVGFTPWQPSGYDPALDAQLGASQRGLGYLQADTATQNTRDTQDYGYQRAGLEQGQQRSLQDIGSGYDRSVQDLTLGRDRGLQDLGLGKNRSLQDLTLGKDRGLFDLGRSYSRGTQDLGTARTQGTEDYERNVAALRRSYDRLATRQGEGATAAGLVGGGAILQAAAKRTENEAWDRAPIDTGQQRFLAANTQAGTRLGEDYGTQTGRVNEDFGISSGRVNEDYTIGSGRLNENFTLGSGRLTADRDVNVQRTNEDAAANLGRLDQMLAPPGTPGSPLGGRAFQDRSTALDRAGLEQTAFEQATGAAKAAGSPYGPPSNEFRDPATGQSRRVVIRGNQRIVLDPSGRVISQRRR